MINICCAIYITMFKFYKKNGRKMYLYISIRNFTVL